MFGDLFREWMASPQNVRGIAQSQERGETPASNIGSLWNDLTGTSTNNSFNAQEAEKARLFNSAEAAKQRDFEAMMSNTAYQRAAADMKAAGINPASLGGNGAASAASTPQGTAAQAQAAHASPASGSGFLGPMISAIGTALRLKFLHSALANSKEGLNVKAFEAESRNALRAAKVADTEVTTAIKQERLNNMKMPKSEKKYAHLGPKPKGLEGRSWEEIFDIARTPWVEG